MAPPRDCARHEEWMRGQEKRIQKLEGGHLVNESEHKNMKHDIADHEVRMRVVEKGNLKLLAYGSAAFFVLSMLAQFLMPYLRALVQTQGGS